MATDKAGLDERYECATSASNLRVDTRDGSPISPADVIIAAGMSPSRLGMALLRLHSEWDGAAKPKKLNAAQITALSHTLKDEKGRPDTYRARREAAAWYAGELRILAQTLKSRAGVMAELMLWANLKGISGETVTASLHHWLNSTCPVCEGHGLRKVDGQPALSAKRCGPCNGTGSVREPDGAARVIGYIDACLNAARSSLKQRLRPR